MPDCWYITTYASNQKLRSASKRLDENNKLTCVLNYTCQILIFSQTELNQKAKKIQLRSLTLIHTHSTLSKLNSKKISTVTILGNFLFFHHHRTTRFPEPSSYLETNRGTLLKTLLFQKNRTAKTFKDPQKTDLKKLELFYQKHKRCCI